MEREVLMSGIAAAIQANYDDLVETMMATTNQDAGTSESDRRQFIAGYVHILAAASREDLGPRDEYLATVIPAIRDGGMPLAVVMDGMVRVATAAGAVLGPKHAKWLSDFQGDYICRILTMWAAP